VTVRSVFTAALCGLLLAGPAAATPVCTGDCNGDGVVSIDELVNGVNILLDNMPVTRCSACDRDGNGTVSVDEVIDAVRSSLNGCPATPTPTPTPTLTPTLTPSVTPSPSTTPTLSPSPPVTPTPTLLHCDVDGVICTVAGTGMAQFDGDGQPALSTSFYFPIDVIFDRQGRLLIDDWNNLRLRRVESDGTVSTVMGNGFEDPTLPMDGALAIDSQLHHAIDVEYDADWQLYLAGDHLPAVFRINTDDRVFTVAGTEDVGYSGDGQPALEAELSTPFGVLPDSAGGFYISDAEVHVVRYVDPQGIIHTVAGTPEMLPTGLWAMGYSGDGDLGTKARLAGPARLKFGPDGALYFCETKNHVIRRLHPDNTIDTFAGTGARGYSGDNGPAKQAQFDTPYDVRFAPNGDVYVADTNNNVIRRIDAAGIVTTVVGNGSPAFAGDGGPAAAASLRRPSAVIFDAEGSMWIADTSNQRVRRVWHFLSTIASAQP
jgi:hypothetical protein